MTILFSTMDNVGGNGSKAFQCGACGSLISQSDRLIRINGSNRHLFLNPEGMECDFHTFYSCPGAIALGEATDAYSWFSGYGWRMAFCGQCGQHLGWFYESVSVVERPREFWGILVSHLVTRHSENSTSNLD